MCVILYVLVFYALWNPHSFVCKVLYFQKHMETYGYMLDDMVFKINLLVALEVMHVSR